MNIKNIIKINNQKDYIAILLMNNMGNEELIMSRLDMLGQEINFIKEHIIDITLTRDDISSLNEAEEDLSEGRTKRL
ncbi:MAG: hypothetical protein AABW67_00525 [Nanoarchaeota archaeon]